MFAENWRGGKTKTYGPETLKQVQVNIVFANFLEDVEVGLRLVQRAKCRVPVQKLPVRRCPVIGAVRLEGSSTYATSMIAAQLSRCWYKRRPGYAEGM